MVDGSDFIEQSLVVSTISDLESTPCLLCKWDTLVYVCEWHLICAPCAEPRACEHESDTTGPA